MGEDGDPAAAVAGVAGAEDEGAVVVAVAVVVAAGIATAGIAAAVAAETAAGSRAAQLRNSNLEPGSPPKWAPRFFVILFALPLSSRKN